MTSVLSVKDLQVKFSTRNSFVTAVDDFSFDLRPVECVGLVGESGCGKTTSGLAIMRLLPGNGHIGAGTIELEGVDLSTLSEKQMQRQRGRTVALIPQDPMSSLNPTMKIGRQIGEGLRIHTGASDEEARKRALEVLEMVEMPRPAERLDQYPFELSGGLRQRVIIAMGLVCQPKLLIADEPTTALDVTIQAQILDIIDSLRKQLQMGVLLITHDMGVIAGRADRVVVMYGGKKAEEASTIDLFRSSSLAEPTAWSSCTGARRPRRRRRSISFVRCATRTHKPCWPRCPTSRTPPSTNWPRSPDCRRTSRRRSSVVVSRHAVVSRPTSAATSSPC